MVNVIGTLSGMTDRSSQAPFTKRSVRTLRQLSAWPGLQAVETLLLPWEPSTSWTMMLLSVYVCPPKIMLIIHLPLFGSVHCLSVMLFNTWHYPMGMGNNHKVALSFLFLFYFNRLKTNDKQCIVNFLVATCFFVSINLFNGMLCT